MLRILIADDERIARQGLCDLVDWRAMDMEVVCTAANGEEALAYMLAHPVDILLTDIKMPRMDGLELLRELGDHGLSPTTVVFSGFSDFQYAQQAIQYGVVSYLLKPIRMNDLTEALRKAAERRGLGQPSGGDDREAVARFRTQTRREAEVMIENIYRAICAGDEGRVREECASLHSLLGNGQYPAEVIRRFAFSGVYDLSRGVSRFLGEDDSLLDDTDRMTLLAVAAGEAAIWHEFLQCVDDLCDHVHTLRRTGHKRVVSDLMSLVQHRYGEESLSLAQLAEELGMTPNYLSALFRKETGETFSEYLEAYRVERAKALLGDVHRKVYEVGMEVGYADSRYFGKVFKKRTGQTPLDYRNGVSRRGDANVEKYEK